MRRPAPPPARRARVVAALLAGLVPTLAAALETDRFALERLADESPWDVAFEYERACWRLGALVASADPVQELEFADARWVRLRITGGAHALRCLEAVEGRRAIDGAMTWFDGFVGGRVLPDTEPPLRVPEAVLVDPSRRLPPAVPPRGLVAEVERGDAEALTRARTLPVGPALALLSELSARRSAGALAALETLATHHSHWRVRRGAVAEIDGLVSFDTIVRLAGSDPAWEVRHAAVEQLGFVAESTLDHAAGRPAAAAEALSARLVHDAAWEVRRNALWQLSSAAVTRQRALIERLATEDADGRVRAAALEVLAGVGFVDRKRARAALSDASPAVRSVALEALVPLAAAEDAPALWAALEDPVRGVRLAATRLFARLDDPTVGARAWNTYLREAAELDADAEALDDIASFLARRPFDALPDAVEARLREDLAPSEARRLVRLLSDAAPSRALATLLPLADAAEPARRALAAEGLPALPAGNSRRLALLEDRDADVRAAAVLGLCRTTNPGARALAEQVDLPSSPLGHEAMLALARCGEPPPAFPLLETRLFAPPGETSRTQAGIDPIALAAVALFLLSILLIKLRAPAGSTPTPPPA